MGARKDVDAVDLVQREPIDGAAQMALIDPGRPGYAEALRGERDAACEGRRKMFGGRAGYSPSIRMIAEKSRPPLPAFWNAW